MGIGLTDEQIPGFIAVMISFALMSAVIIRVLYITKQEILESRKRRKEAQAASA